MCQTAQSDPFHYLGIPYTDDAGKIPMYNELVDARIKACQDPAIRELIEKAAGEVWNDGSRARLLQSAVAALNLSQRPNGRGPQAAGDLMYRNVKLRHHWDDDYLSRVINDELAGRTFERPGPYSWSPRKHLDLSPRSSRPSYIYRMRDYQYSPYDWSTGIRFTELLSERGALPAGSDVVERGVELVFGVPFTDVDSKECGKLRQERWYSSLPCQPIWWARIEDLLCPDLDTHTAPGAIGALRSQYSAPLIPSLKCRAVYLFICNPEARGAYYCVLRLDKPPRIATNEIELHVKRLRGGTGRDLISIWWEWPNTGPASFRVTALCMSSRDGEVKSESLENPMIYAGSGLPHAGGTPSADVFVTKLKDKGSYGVKWNCPADSSRERTSYEETPT